LTDEEQLELLAEEEEETSADCYSSNGCDVAATIGVSVLMRVLPPAEMGEGDARCADCLRTAAAIAKAELKDAARQSGQNGGSLKATLAPAVRALSATCVQNCGRVRSRAH